MLTEVRKCSHQVLDNPKPSSPLKNLQISEITCHCSLEFKTWDSCAQGNIEVSNSTTNGTQGPYSPALWSQAHCRTTSCLRFPDMYNGRDDRWISEGCGEDWMWSVVRSVRCCAWHMENLRYLSAMGMMVDIWNPKSLETGICQSRNYKGWWPQKHQNMMYLTMKSLGSQQASPGFARIDMLIMGPGWDLPGSVASGSEFSGPKI